MAHAISSGGNPLAVVHVVGDVDVAVADGFPRVAHDEGEQPAGIHRRKILIGPGIEVANLDAVAFKARLHLGIVLAIERQQLVVGGVAVLKGDDLGAIHVAHLEACARTREWTCGRRDRAQYSLSLLREVGAAPAVWGKLESVKKKGAS